MKSDLDQLMAKRGLDAIIVTGDEHGNPMRNYLTNGAAVTGRLCPQEARQRPDHGCQPDGN